MDEDFLDTAKNFKTIKIKKKLKQGETSELWDIEEIERLKNKLMRLI